MGEIGDLEHRGRDGQRHADALDGWEPSRHRRPSRRNAGPQNKSGLFQIYDVTGKVVFRYTLPPWSNEQSFKLPELSDGVYSCVITSGMERVSRKIKNLITCLEVLAAFVSLIASPTIS